MSAQGVRSRAPLKATAEMWGVLSNALSRSRTMMCRQPAPLAPLRSLALGMPQRRGLCEAADAGVDEAVKAEVREFLRVSSRPIMGQAKKKRTAGQKAVDLLKHEGRFEDVNLHELLRMDSEELKRRGLQPIERKLILRYGDKFKQGYRHDGRAGKHAWKGWLPPYRQPGHPSDGFGKRSYQYDDLAPETNALICGRRR